jgi:hypothetical protein
LKHNEHRRQTRNEKRDWEKHEQPTQEEIGEHMERRNEEII